LGRRKNGSASTDQSTLAPSTAPPKKYDAKTPASIASPSTYEALPARTSTWNSGLRNEATSTLVPAMPKELVPFFCSRPRK